MEISYLDIFNEENWNKYIPKKFLINAQVFEIDQDDT